MIDHVSLGVASIEASRSFYDAALRPLGLVRTVDSAVEADYGFASGSLGVEFTITSYPGGTSSSLGSHICFRAPSRAAVEAFHRAALESGGRDDGAPGLRPQYHPSYFAAFVLDPDGHRIESVCHAPEASGR
jgi:catechol 2,3-dioxygenase-like lactoylglutathione lyase family enzyme